MTIYIAKHRSFVSPICAKPEIDGDAHGDVYVYEVAAGKRSILMKSMRIVPKVAALTIAVLLYANFFVQDELKRMMWLYVMLVPAFVYFGALLHTTTFPRRVGVSGMRLILSATDDSVIFCSAQLAVFVPMTLAFTVVAQMHWRPSLTTLFALVVVGVFPVAASAFAVYRLRLVLRASAKSARSHKS